MRDAQAMTDTLADKWRFTPDEVKSMNEASWAKLANDSGVQMPTTKAARNRVEFELQKRLMGPEVSGQELLQRLRDSLAEGKKPAEAVQNVKVRRRKST